MDARLLPYVSGTMCFSTGMALKLAVSRWSNWSADVGIRDERRTDAGCDFDWLLDSAWGESLGFCLGCWGRVGSFLKASHLVRGPLGGI